MSFISYIFPTNAREIFEQILKNATAAADNSAKIVESIGYRTLNLSALGSAVNTGTKPLSLGYGIGLTGASAIDAVTAKNTYSRYLFRLGCGFGAVGTASSAVTAFNSSVGLGPVALVSGAAGSAFYLLGKKTNGIARIADIPGV